MNIIISTIVTTSTFTTSSFKYLLILICRSNESIGSTKLPIDLVQALVTSQTMAQVGDYRFCKPII